MIPSPSTYPSAETFEVKIQALEAELKKAFGEAKLNVIKGIILRHLPTASMQTLQRGAAKVMEEIESYFEVQSLLFSELQRISLQNYVEILYEWAAHKNQEDTTPCREALREYELVPLVSRGRVYCTISMLKNPPPCPMRGQTHQLMVFERSICIQQCCDTRVHDYPYLIKID